MSAINNSEKLASVFNIMQTEYPNSNILLLVGDRQKGGLISYHISKGQTVDSVTFAIANLLVRWDGKSHLRDFKPVIESPQHFKDCIKMVESKFEGDAVAIYLYSGYDGYQAWISNSDREDMKKVLHQLMNDFRTDKPLPNMGSN